MVVGLEVGRCLTAGQIHGVVRREVPRLEHVRHIFTSPPGTLQRQMSVTVYLSCQQGHHDAQYCAEVDLEIHSNIRTGEPGNWFDMQLYIFSGSTRRSPGTGLGTTKVECVLGIYEPLADSKFPVNIYFIRYIRMLPRSRAPTLEDSQP